MQCCGKISSQCCSDCHDAAVLTDLQGVWRVWSLDLLQILFGCSLSYCDANAFVKYCHFVTVLADLQLALLTVYNPTANGASTNFLSISKIYFSSQNFSIILIYILKVVIKKWDVLVIFIVKMTNVLEGKKRAPSDVLLYQLLSLPLTDTFIHLHILFLSNFFLSFKKTGYFSFTLTVWEMRPL